MNYSPILIVAGEPNSIFLEIFFKAIKFRNFKSPIILICCKKILLNQMKINNYYAKLNLLDLKKLKKYKLNNEKINLINVECIKKNNKFNRNLTNNYINKSFDLAISLLKKNLSYKFINGPINKESFLKKKFLGITEYITKKFKVKKTGMLIFNKKLSVSPLTTHLPLKLVASRINQKLIEEKISLINIFYKKNFKFKPKIAVTGLNPHCESILKFNEDKKIIPKAINSQKKKM
jgi:4-hydroxy-L-threonine phosphate dehydrogenase PdxA